MKYPLKDKSPSIPKEGSVGDFAFRRSFYHHPGIDLYCDYLQVIQAIEDGIVVNIEHFTGAEANPPSPWWNDTWSIMIEGKSGVIGYCEILPRTDLKVGSLIEEGEAIALIAPVLKKDKGNGTTMLHFELYTHGTKQHVTWKLDEEKPKNLLNPRDLLKSFIDEKV